MASLLARTGRPCPAGPGTLEFLCEWFVHSLELEGFTNLGALQMMSAIGNMCPNPGPDTD